MVILRTRNKITDFLMILAWASPFSIASLITHIDGDLGTPTADPLCSGYVSFFSMVTPILLYGCEAWGGDENINMIEKLNIRYCKYVLKKTSTPTCMVLG